MFPCWSIKCGMLIIVVAIEIKKPAIAPLNPYSLNKDQIKAI
jgi:hypothetical protein